MTTVSYQLTGEDHLACLRHGLTRIPPRLRRMHDVRRLLLLILLIALLALALAGRWRQDYALAMSLTLILVLCLCAAWLHAWRLGSGQGRWLARQGGASRLCISPAGLQFTYGNERQWHAWTGLVAMEETPLHLFLHLRRGPVQIVPKRAFADHGSLNQFTGLIRTFWAETPQNAGRSLPAQCPVGPAKRGQWRREILANLRAGARLVLFRPVDCLQFTATPDHLLAIWLWILALQASIDYCFALPVARFDVTGFAAFGCSTLLFIVGVTLMGMTGGLLAGTLRLLLMLTTAQLFVSVPYVMVMDAIESDAFSTSSWATWQTRLAWLVFFAFMIWMLAIVYRSVRLLRRLPGPTALFLTAIFAVWVYALPLQLPGQSFFYPASGDTPGANAATRVDVEAAYYRQPQLLEDELRNLLPQRAGVSDLYFLGFAGDAGQKVFAHEVKYARDLFTRRFHTNGRSVLLVNSAATVDRLPLANDHNLATALDAIGRRMDPAEDVLFIFLTSHGSRDHHLVVQFSPLGLDDLSPRRLRAMLDHAGIRYRVIVVSACYSGGFLDVLKNKNSLIITASRRDRTSFGCSADRDFTYFGEAYFRDALNRTSSFVKAYALASGIVGKREIREGDVPSEPQIFVGRNIAGILAGLEANAAGNPGIARRGDEK